MIDRLRALLLGKKTAIILVVLMLMFHWADFAPDDRVAVEIYKNPESGEMTYCQTGTLNPPMVYMGSGKISATKASSWA